MTTSYPNYDYVGNWFDNWGQKMKRAYGLVVSDSDEHDYDDESEVKYSSMGDDIYDDEEDIKFGDTGIGPGAVNQEYFQDGRSYSSKKHYEELQELLGHNKPELAIVPYNSGGGGNEIGPTGVQVGPTGPFTESGGNGTFTSRFRSWNLSSSWNSGSSWNGWNSGSNSMSSKKSTCYRCQKEVWWVCSDGWCNPCVERMRLKQEV